MLRHATDTARAQAEAVTHFRNFYAKELAPRAVEAGMSLTHDLGERNSLPLPATLTIELGRYLSRESDGTQVRLYSQLPFPGREQDRVLDQFQLDALAHLEWLASHIEGPSVTFDLAGNEVEVIFRQLLP